MRLPIRARISLLFAFFLIFASCDDFQLRDYFDRLVLTAEGTRIPQGGSVLLNARGGERPYVFRDPFLIEHEYIDEENDNPEGELNVVSSDRAVYSAADTIGRVLLGLADGAGADDYLVITILPATPTNFEVELHPHEKHVTITWEHTEPGVERFLIERAVGDGPFDKLTWIDGSDEYKYDDDFDEGILPNTEYSYRMYAVAGALRSSPTPTQAVSTAD